MSSPDPQARPVLVTGATGYVGGRLVPRLLEKGLRVRCLARSPEKLSARSWSNHPLLEIAQGDLQDPETLDRSMAGCGAAYYLVHSMLAAGSEYARRDQEMARSFAASADRNGLDRIIYLGGLGELGEDLSEHLRSRREVEEALASGSVPVTVFRAAMIIGSGSSSFEILRYLVERLPVMVTPRWVRTECQPIGIRNVLGYLVDPLDEPETRGLTLDIGGTDVMSYEDLMQIMAEEVGLPRRIIIPVPVLTPRLSSLWIHLITPLDKEIARPLAEGLRNRVVCRDDRAQQLLPQPLLGAREAIRLAIARTEESEVETVWSSAGPIPGDPEWAGGTVFLDEREVSIPASREAVFRAVCRLGGSHGWYAADGLWRLRGLLDRLVGGPGLRRGRRDPEKLEFGDALDFWRVIRLTPHRRLTLRAEMRLPGVADLDFQVTEEGKVTCLRQTARFRPRGLMGIFYWYAVLPFHHVVFQGMLNGIRDAAVATPTR